MNLIRKLKISKLTSVDFTKKEKEIIEFINSKLEDLIPFKHEDYQNSMFYMNSNSEWILQQDNKNDRLWVRYEDFWEVLESDYSMNDEDIQIILKYMVEQAFKVKVSTPPDFNRSQGWLVEQAFKVKVSTPFVKEGEG